MEILMPQLGETVTEGTISKWHKAEGESVAAGDALFEIETDKTSMEVPAVVAGVLGEIRVAAGVTVPVGTVVGVVAERGEAPAASPAHPSVQQTRSVAVAPASVARTGSHQSSAANARASGAEAAEPVDRFHDLRTPRRNFGKARLPSGVKVSPRARRLAAQASVDLARVRATGPRGCIVAADVLRAQQAVQAGPVDRSNESEQVKSVYADTSYREVPLDSMRKTIARRLSEATQQVPHFYVSGEVNVEALLALRKQVNEASTERVSINDCIVKAYALALQRVPAANVAWAGDRLLQFEHSDISVAVAIPGGLVTPVVRDAEVKSLMTLTHELSELARRARERALQPSEYVGGAATVSNLGMYGVRSFQAIINPPQATILAVGAAQRRVNEARDGTLYAATMLSVSISADHRVVDGVAAAELFAAFRQVIETPISIVL